MGRRNRPYYRICVMDTRTRRDGRSIEDIGTYNVVAEDDQDKYTLNIDRLKYWISVGAKPSETVASIMKKLGVS
jgi:small subunit ribosomal protein S16